jgi:hypothetical protein
LSEPTKVQVDKFTKPDDKFSETKINEWTHRSQKEGLCGILNCYNKSITKCKKCMNYYCQEHMKSHYDLVPEGEYQQEKGDNSLDYYS